MPSVTCLLVVIKVPAAQDWEKVTHLAKMHTALPHPKHCSESFANMNSGIPTNTCVDATVTHFYR